MTVSSIDTRRLIAVDVDGTLVAGGRRVSPAVRAAVRHRVRRGDYLALASGRTVAAMLPILDQLGMSDGYAVCANGAVLLDIGTGKPLHVSTFDPRPVVAAIEPILPDAVFAAEVLGVGNRVTAPFAAGELTGQQLVVSREELVDSSTPRLAACWPTRSPAEAEAAFAGVVLPGVGWTLDHEKAWMLVAAEGVSKATALERLRLQLGVPAECTVAVGNGSNDIEMLRWAGLGIAMGQAPEAVRACADEVTGTVLADGLATVLARLSDRSGLQ